MTRLPALKRCSAGTAAAEMALVMPFLLLLLFCCFELGNYFLKEHMLLKGVRDGARYAARQPMSEYTACAGSPSATVVDDTKALVRTGQITGGADLMPNWDDPGTVFTVTITCKTTDTGAVGGTALAGIYEDNLNGAGAPIGAPIVTVTAHVPYEPILGVFTFTGEGFKMKATQQAAVMGI